MKKITKSVLILLATLSLIACEGGSGGGSKKKNNGRTGAAINSESSSLAQSISGVEFCSVASVQYDNESEYSSEKTFFKEDGSYNYSRVGSTTGKVIEESTGKWGATETHLTVVQAGESQKIKVKYEKGILTLFIPYEGEEYEEDYKACGGRPVSENSENNESSEESSSSIVGKQYCGYDEDGDLNGSTMEIQQNGVITSSLENGETITGQWSGMTESAFIVSIMGQTQLMTYEVTGNDLHITYSDDGFTELESYTLCK
jgi:hypothetical protein